MSTFSTAENGLITIHTVWATRKHEPETPELVTAWDEFSVDDNPSGFREDVVDRLASWGSDLKDHREIDIRVPLEFIRGAFRPVAIVALQRESSDDE